VDIYSTRNKIKIITILKDTSLELSKASLLTPFYGTDKHEASRGLFATADLLVSLDSIPANDIPLIAVVHNMHSRCDKL